MPNGTVERRQECLLIRESVAVALEYLAHESTSWLSSLASALKSGEDIDFEDFHKVELMTDDMTAFVSSFVSQCTRAHPECVIPNVSARS